jgi:hypothetical protein
MVTLRDNPAVPPNLSSELGHPRVSLRVYPTPGHPLTVTIDTVEPARTEAPVVDTQPMAQPQTTRVSAPRRRR